MSVASVLSCLQFFLVYVILISDFMVMVIVIVIVIFFFNLETILFLWMLFGF